MIRIFLLLSQIVANIWQIQVNDSSIWKDLNGIFQSKQSPVRQLEATSDIISAKWINLAVFASSGCTGLPSRGNSIGIGACQHMDNGGWKFAKYTVSKDGKVSQNFFTSSSCSGTSLPGDSIALGCHKLRDNEYLSATVDVVYSYPVDAVMYKVYKTGDLCSSENALDDVDNLQGVEFFSYQIHDPSKHCVSVPNLPKSYSYSCADNSVTTTRYDTSPICSGDGDSYIFASDVACSTGHRYDFYYGYPYFTCYKANNFNNGPMIRGLCFPESVSVQLLSGLHRSIASINIGDSILVYSESLSKSFYSEVISLPHGNKNSTRQFLRERKGQYRLHHITTIGNGHNISLTADHLIPVSRYCNASSTLLTAAEVHRGDCIMTANSLWETVGSNQGETIAVADLDRLYTVVTKEGDFVVVNGIVASPFAINHAVANGYYSLHRFFYPYHESVLRPLDAFMNHLVSYFLVY